MTYGDLITIPSTSDSDFLVIAKVNTGDIIDSTIEKAKSRFAKRTTDQAELFGKIGDRQLTPAEDMIIAYIKDSSRQADNLYNKAIEHYELALMYLEKAETY